MTYIVLFLLFAKVSLLTFGGGMASLPFLYEIFVIQHQWLSAGVFSETIALAQMTPGPIIINSATLLGYRFAGIPGSIIATSAVIIAPLLVVMSLSWIFKHASGTAGIWVNRIRIAMRPVVVGLLIVALYTITLPVLKRPALWSLTGVSAVLYFTVPFFRKYPQALLFGMAIAGSALYAFGITAIAAS